LLRENDCDQTFPLEYPGVDIARTLGTEAEWKFGDPLQITNERKELVKTHELKDVWVGVLVAAVNLPDDSFVSILAGESLRFNDSGMDSAVSFVGSRTS